ncbi:MAG: tetratricopeptide repeat protein, partial [Legionella longbeachae]|nr:tetratricopeptide repeat protein [Legionella longbeachae]
NSAKLFKGALSFIKKALELCSENPVFLQSAASWYEQYIEVLERAVENEDVVQKNIASNFSYAIQYYRKALSVCHEQDLALRNIILSNLTECLAQYGHHLYKNKDYKNAQKIYLEAMHLDPEHLIVINQIGMSLFKQDCFPEARKYFSSILEKTEDKQEIADAWLNIACTYRLEKKWEKAEEALRQAKKFAPEDFSITEEEMKVNESKLAALLISTSQTLFGCSNPDSQGAGSKTVQESSFQFEFN